MTTICVCEWSMKRGCCCLGNDDCVVVAPLTTTAVPPIASVVVVASFVLAVIVEIHPWPFVVESCCLSMAGYCLWWLVGVPCWFFRCFDSNCNHRRGADCCHVSSSRCMTHHWGASTWKDFSFASPKQPKTPEPRELSFWNIKTLSSCFRLYSISTITCLLHLFATLHTARMITMGELYWLLIHCFCLIVVCLLLTSTFDSRVRFIQTATLDLAPSCLWFIAMESTESEMITSESLWLIHLDCCFDFELILTFFCSALCSDSIHDIAVSLWMATRREGCLGGLR